MCISGGKLKMAPPSSHVINLILRNSVFQGRLRSLYSAATLGVDNYLSVREKTKSQFDNVEGKFRERMKKYLDSPTQNMIFTEDLKNMIHLINKDERDIELCLEMLKRFNSQNKELRFGTYVFGPVIMRMFYYLELPDLAFKIIRDNEFDGLFNQVSSYQILMDSLYKKEKYADVVKVFELLQDRQLHGSKYPKDCVVLVSAACYKLNTKESFDFTMKLIRGIREAGSNILRKGVSLAAALALKQNNPQIAMEILSLSTQPNYVTIKNLRMIALCELDRLDDVFGSVNALLGFDSPTTHEKRTGLMPETLEAIKSAVKRNGTKEVDLQLKQAEKSLLECGRLSNETLDQLLCCAVPPRFDATSTRYRSYNPTYLQRPKKGLRDYDD